MTRNMITAADVVTAITAQELTLIARERAISADDVAFIVSARTTAQAVLSRVSVSAIVREIKANREHAEASLKVAEASGDADMIARAMERLAAARTTLSVNSAIKYHALTGMIFLKGDDLCGYAPRDVQTAVKTLTNGGMTRECESAIKEAATVQDAMISIEELLVIKDARDAERAASKTPSNVNDVDGESDTDGESGEKAPRVKDAQDYLKAISGPISKLAEMTATAEQAAYARDLIASLLTFAATAPVQSTAVVGESTVKVGTGAVPRQKGVTNIVAQVKGVA
jgi:hypothetical protein